MSKVRTTALIVALVCLAGVDPVSLSHLTARAQGPVIQPKSAVAVSFAESIAIRDLPGDASTRLLGEHDFERPNKELPKSVAATATGDEDGAIVVPPVIAPAPSPSLSFDGVSSQDNFTNFGFRLSPPDTDGEVGPHHYLQYVNLLFRVYAKDGTPLTAPLRLSSLYLPLGGQCAQPDNGDPIVLYDQLADRWLISQFAFIGSGTEPPYHECIAISKTGDPTGGYYLYDFLVPTVQFNDYPKIGVWPDGYYMTANQFNRGVAFDGTGVFAFNRRKMLVGDPTANMIYFDLNLATHPEAIGGMLPSDLDGLKPPPRGAPNTFVYFIANEFGDALDGLRFFDFRADFEVPANSTFSERQTPLPVPAFDPRSPANRSDIEQPPPALNSHALDSISDRLLFRLAYRNFGAHESLVVNHTVNVGTGTTLATHRAGVRLYELRRQSLTGAFAVHAAQTLAGDAPDADNRWMGSAAQDNDGNIAVGYSVSSLTTFPSIRYSGRLADGTARTESTMVTGTGVQRSTGGRWGDYSALSVDPVDDCTFWYTNEYYTAASQALSTIGWLTRVGAFRFDECTPAPRATLTGRVYDAASGAPIAGATIDLGDGRMTSTGADGAYTIYQLPGLYTVRAVGAHHNKVQLSTVLADGTTTTLDLKLDPTGADLFVTKVGPAQAVTGADLTYTITAGNHGPLPVPTALVTDPIPAGTSLVAVTTTTGTCTLPRKADSGAVTCSMPLAVGETATITLVLRATIPAGVVSNAVSIASLVRDIRDYARHNNVATASTTITCGGDVTVTAGAIGTATGPNVTAGTQTGRLFRSGAPSVCAFPKAFPGLGATTGTRRYDAYQYTNEGTAPACVTVTVTTGASCASNLLYTAAYLGPFNPNNLAENFLADSGSSPSPAASPPVPTVSYSFTAPAGGTFTVVFHEVNPQPATASCGAYTFTLSNVPKACGPSTP